MGPLSPLVLLLTASAPAATLKVCATCPYTTIASAVGAASDGDTVSVGPGSWVEDVEVRKDLTIRGAGAGRTIWSNSEETSEFALTVPAGNVVVAGLTFEDPDPDWSGAIYVEYASLTLVNVEVVRARRWVGAALDAWGATVDIQNCLFDGNSSPTAGGAIYTQHSDVTISDSTFVSNSTESEYGSGAIHCNGGTMAVTRTRFEANYGGAIYGCYGEITDSDFVDHTADVAIYSGGGKIESVTMRNNQSGVYSWGGLEVTGSTFADHDQSAIILAAGVNTVTDSRFVSGLHAIGVQGGEATLRGNTFEGNGFFSSDGYGPYGGAIAVSHLTSVPTVVEIDRNRFTGNVAGDGGAVYAWIGDTLTITNNVFCANEAGTDGGAVWLEGREGASLRVANNVFAENVAGAAGGGLYYASDRELTPFVNNTWLGNGAAEGGAAYVADDFSWVNDLVAATTAGDGLTSSDPLPDSWELAYGSWYLNVANDVGGGLDAALLDGTHVAGDPGIASWSADGDCGNDDFSLRIGSRLIDAGDPSLSDPDGTRSDIGAYGGPGADPRDPADTDGDADANGGYQPVPDTGWPDTGAPDDTDAPDETDVPDDTDGADTDRPEPDEPPGRCGCALSSPPSAFPAILLAGVALLWRRRAAGALLLAPGAAQAATLEVCSTCAYTTVSDAVAAASSGDTVSVGAGEYTEDVLIATDLTLQGAGIGSTVLYNSSSTSRPAIYVSGGLVVTISAMTIDDDDPSTADDGGIYTYHGVDLTLTDVAVQNQRAFRGAGVYVDYYGTATIERCTFDGNYADYGPGGGLVLNRSSGTITDSTFTANQSYSTYIMDGGAIYAFGADTDTVVISGCTFTGNEAENGAAVYGGASLVVTDSTFEGNVGRSIVAAYGSRLERVTFSGNDGGYGGVLYGRDLEIVSATFADNTGTPLRVTGPYATDFTTVDDSTFSSNDAYWGGAIMIEGGTVWITGSTFTSNSADYDGGAIDAGTIAAGGEVDLLDNRFTDNEAGWYGGAVFGELEDGTLSIRNNVVCANLARKEGGGLWLRREASTTWTVANNVLAENTAGYGGGLYYESASAATGVFHHNSLLGNTATYGGAAWLASDFEWVGNLVVSTAGGDGLSAPAAAPAATLRYDGWYLNTTADLGGGLASTTLDSTHVLGDPLIAGWSDDGDCTSDDFGLLTGSPAIDAGDPSESDLDGTRPDLGATGGPGAWLHADLDGDGYVGGRECDDGLASVHPGATEVCNGTDDDCNGLIDDSPADGTEYWRDADADGYGDPRVSLVACSLPFGYVTVGGDCFDTDPTRIGEPTWYGDGDGDGFGDLSVTTVACDAPSGYVAEGTDCDDADPAVSPAADEPWADSNCDGSVGDADADADGTQACDDCDDADPAYHAAADELCDGEDNDCDGLLDEAGAIWGATWYPDEDGDGHGDPGRPRKECEAPSGYVASADDCLDSDEDAWPGAPEKCDHVDNDCDGTVDEEVSGMRSYYRDADGDGYGADEDSVVDCFAPEGYVPRNRDCDDTNEDIRPFAEDIPGDGIDQDCDGEDAAADTDQADTDVDSGETDAPGPKDCGCASSGPDAPAALVLAALVASALRRRRRADHSRK